MEWIGFGFDLDLIWIEIGVLKFFKECARSPCNGNHFSSCNDYCTETDQFLKQKSITWINYTSRPVLSSLKYGLV